MTETEKEAFLVNNTMSGTIDTGALIEEESKVIEASEKARLINTDETASISATTSNKVGDSKNGGKVLPAAEKSRNKGNSFKFMMQYAYRECSSICIGIVFLLGGSMSDLTVPLFVGRAIDLLQKGKYDQVNTLVLHMVIVVSISAVFVGLRAAVFNILSERIARNLRRDFYNSIISKDVAFYDERRTGDLISRLNSDIQVV